MARQNAACGRFAPTPSGPLHLGSLVAAVGSYLSARALGGRWRLRIDDLDRPRVVAGAAETILKTLAAHGLAWDGPVVYQSHRMEAYRAARDELLRDGAIYRCSCTRREIALAGLRSANGTIYPGTCRTTPRPHRVARSWRADMRGIEVSFEDPALGTVTTDVAEKSGDFLVWRADGLPAYHLACIVDEAYMGITQVVRGMDLLESTACQIGLARVLHIREPSYAHLPLVRGPDGRKLGKSRGSQALMSLDATANLRTAMELLGMSVPQEIDSPSDTLEWGVRNFDWQCVRGMMQAGVHNGLTL